MTAEHTKNDAYPRGLKNPRGQTALVMLLIVAVAMVFLAISMNWGRVAEYKTMTTIGANVSAAHMASSMSSYGEMVLQTTLGGKTKICGWTGILAIVIAIVIIIILIVITAFCPACAPITGSVAMMVIGLVLAVAALAIQVLILQPGLTDLWNKMQQDLSIEGQFLERGIQSGLINAVTDNKNIADKMDMDRDGYHPLNSEDEVINRFGHYYTRRLQSVQALNLPEVERFMDGLKKITYAEGGGPQDWRISDPVDCSAVPHSTSTYCNPCCMPADQRPDSCHEGLTQPYPRVHRDCEVPDVPVTPAEDAFFPHVYNPLRENELNNSNILSFRERLGWDDEMREFKKNPRNPNYPRAVEPPDPYEPDIFTFQNDVFRMEDATGFYSAANQAAMVNRGLMPEAPPTAITPDRQQGIFPFFWKLADWAPGVALITETTTESDPGCHWCAADDPQRGACNSDPLTSPQLTLPTDCDSHDCCVGYHRDGENGFDSPVTDVVYSAPEYGIANALANTNMCALKDANMDPLTGVYTGMHWKKGGDRYCSPDWPYWGDCPKHGNAGCAVLAIDESEFVGGQEVNPETGQPYDDDPAYEAYEEGTPPCACQEPAPDWPDDPLDELVYGLEDYLRFVNKLSAASVKDLEKTFIHWYPNSAAVIGRQCEAAWGCENDEPEDQAKCSACNIGEDGILRRWRDQLLVWSTQIGDWIYQYRDAQNTWFNADGFAEPLTDPNTGQIIEAWCIPPDPETLPPAEKYYIQRNGYDPYYRLEEVAGGFGAIGCTEATNSCTATGENCTHSIQQTFVADKWGDLADVTACLDYNSRNFRGQRGNEYLFHSCFLNPAAPSCSNLPRTLLKGWDLYANTEYYAASAFDACLRSPCNGSVPADAACEPEKLPSGYDLTGYDAVNRCSTAWLPGNPSYDIIAANRETAYLAAFGPNPGDGFKPPVQEDVDLLQACLDSCSEATCGADVLLSTVDGSALVWEHPFDPATTCGEWGSVNDYTNLFKREVKAAMNGDRDMFMRIYRSGELAVDQYEKFRKRAAFLKNLRAEAEQVRQHFSDAVYHLTDFLDPSVTGTDPETGEPILGSAEGLICARERVEDEPPADLSNFAIYAWKGEPPTIPDAKGSRTKKVRGSGYWHVVRAEGYLPKRCFGRCGPNGTGSEDWPKVKTYTKSWGMKRCYELVNRVGITRARVTRFDEDRDPDTRLMMANGKNIWKFVFHNPVIGHREPANLDATCHMYVEEGAEGAFMINQYPMVDLENGNFTEAEAAAALLCWDRVHTLLHAGVSSISCGQYYLRGDNFVSRFIPCPDDNFFESTGITEYEPETEPER